MSKTYDVSLTKEEIMALRQALRIAKGNDLMVDKADAAESAFAKLPDLRAGRNMAGMKNRAVKKVTVVCSSCGVKLRGNSRASQDGVTDRQTALCSKCR